MKPTYGEFVGGIAFLGAVAVVAYAALFRTGDFASLALGAIIGVVGGGLGFFLRAKISGPGTGDGNLPGVTVTDSGPTVVNPDPRTVRITTTGPTTTAGGVTLKPPDPPRG
jgi:hypothetical protein